MCEYTCHGHCGILEGERLDNDETLEYLAKMLYLMLKQVLIWLHHQI